MVVKEMQDNEVEALIAKSVDESVERAFKKYRVSPNHRVSLKYITKIAIALIAIAMLVIGGKIWSDRLDANKKVAPVEDHDLTLSNNGIFGFTAADFETPILGVASRQKLLIVEEQEAYVNTTITDTGLFNWGIFNKQQALTIHGTGQYTIDLSKITNQDIQLNEEAYELTIRIPHPELHATNFDPSKTEVGDSQNGWLAFGNITLTNEQHKEFETTALQKLNEVLMQSERFTEADRFAKLSAYETYQAVAKTISPAYRVVIDFQE